MARLVRHLVDRVVHPTRIPGLLLAPKDRAAMAAAAAEARAELEKTGGLESETKLRERIKKLAEAA